MKRLNNKIIVLDFSGTLVKPFLAEQANLKRYDILGIPGPSEKTHKRLHATKKHYDIIRRYISEKYGIKENMEISFIQNYGEEIRLNGKDVKTMIMTDLFRDCMYFAAKKNGLKVYPEGLLGALKNIKKNGYKLAIISGIRTDIISGILAITKCPIKFDYILGQDPVLSRDDQNFLIKELARFGRIKYIIGDKTDDLSPAKRFGIKSIFVKWGHPVGGEEKIADYTVSRPADLNKVIIG